jgi:hypothetical protein
VHAVPSAEFMPRAQGKVKPRRKKRMERKGKKWKHTNMKRLRALLGTIGGHLHKYIVNVMTTS